jgi:tetratricopeptide (TPR) repeat protein
LAVLGCLAIPAIVNAESIDDCFKSARDWKDKGEYDKALAALNQALRLLDPKDTTRIAAAYSNRGLVWEGKGEYDKAMADYNQALAISPNYASAYNNRGGAWFNKGEYDKALADFNQALRLFDPKDATNIAGAYNNRGFVWWQKGEFDKAIADCNQAIAINPKNAGAYFRRAEAWQDKSEYDKAIADYNQALVINPNDADFYNAIALLHAACPDEKYRDGKKAVEEASKVCHLDGGKSWDYIDTLAVAYGESGDLEKAKEWEAKAIKMAPDDERKQGCRSRLELYKQRKPYRDEPKKK